MQTDNQGVMPSQRLFNYCRECKPIPGSTAELEAFEKIQQGFASQFELFFPDNLAPKTIVVIPSLTLDQIAMFHGLHFDGATQKEVMFHMIGALSQFGKMGMVCIGASQEEAYSFYTKTIAVLDAETAG